MPATLIIRNLSFCRVGVWLKRFWKTGARFDTVQWAEKVRLSLATRSLIVLAD